MGTQSLSSRCAKGRCSALDPAAHQRDQRQAQVCLTLGQACGQQGPPVQHLHPDWVLECVFVLCFAAELDQGCLAVGEVVLVVGVALDVCLVDLAWEAIALAAPAARGERGCDLACLERLEGFALEVCLVEACWGGPQFDLACCWPGHLQR